MAYPKVKTTLGGGSKSRNRGDYRAHVKKAAKKLRRREAKEVTVAELNKAVDDYLDATGRDHRPVDQRALDRRITR